MAGRPAILQAVRELLGDQQLIVVSNREPYVHRRAARDVTVERPTGGLVAALDPVLQAVSGTWVAWGSGEADFDVTDAHDRLRVPPGAGAYTLRRVRLTRAEVDGYYYGYANQALWPLCHMAMEHARFRRRSWALYQSASRRFAEAAADEAGQDALVWIHDYHLALVPRLLSDRRPDLFLMHFWHIPWPAWDIFRACPQRADLLEGLLANDLMAFQHSRHAEHFLECVEREVGAQVTREDGIVEFDGHVTRVATFPISVDMAALDALARSRDCDRWTARLRRRLGLQGRRVAVGVDRLDYTKGIPERLRALDRFFERFPEHRGQLVFIQKSAPSRTRIQAYRALQRRVESEITRLNAKYGTPAWQPVIHLPRPLPPAGMAALYRMAEVCVVSSLQDGMNLVAKEYVACQVDQRGVLVLSDMAGARSELVWSVPINPYDATGCADAIGDALRMPDDERRDRMMYLRAYVAEHDIYHWMAQHLRTAADLMASRAATPWVRDRLGEIKDRVLAGRATALLADFDGTLAPIMPAPDDAALSEGMRAALERLVASGVLVGVISGRSLDDVRARVGIDRIIYAGNHGLEIAGPGWRWTVERAAGVRRLLAVAVERLRDRLRVVPGVRVEDKGLSGSVHFRQTPYPYMEQVRTAVFEEGTKEELVIHRGKRVIELRPNVPWDKGAAVRWILHRAFGDRWRNEVAVIYLGDDRTDEDAFLTLPELAVTIRVDPRPGHTAALYAARDVAEVAQFLTVLASWMPNQGHVALPSAEG